MKNTKNYFFILLAITYFLAYYGAKLGFYHIPELILNIKNIVNINYLNNIFSFINAIFSLILFFYLFNIIQNKFNTFLINKTKNLKYNELITNIIKKFINISKFIISIYLAINVALIPDVLKNITNKLFTVSFLISFLILLNSLINGIFKELEKKEQKDAMSKHVFPIINKFIIIFIWIVGIITILSNLGYNVSALITGAGVGGLAVALAAQKTVANIFGAINVIINRPFKIGNRIKIGTNEGIVKDIGMIYLRLENDNGNEVLIPNETIISATIENMSKNK